MSELELRMHCLTLAIQHLHKQSDHQAASVTAQQFFNFLAPANVGRGVEHNAANVHPTHPTTQ